MTNAAAGGIFSKWRDWSSVIEQWEHTSQSWFALLTNLLGFRQNKIFVTGNTEAASTRAACLARGVRHEQRGVQCEVRNEERFPPARTSSWQSTDTGRFDQGQKLPLHKHEKTINPTKRKSFLQAYNIYYFIFRSWSTSLIWKWLWRRVHNKLYKFALKSKTTLAGNNTHVMKNPQPQILIRSCKLCCFHNYNSLINVRRSSENKLPWCKTRDR